MVVNDRVAVVTGGASGIGLALVNQFLRDGMRVVMADVDDEALNRAADSIGAKSSKLLCVKTDVADAHEVESLANQTLEHFGSVYVVCNNAGVNAYGFRTWDAPLATWEWVFRVNLWGLIHGIRTFVPLLIDANEGHIFNVSSRAGMIGLPNLAPYTATKHAIIGVSESLQRELNEIGSAVKVSVVVPTRTKTRIRSSSRLWPNDLGPSAAVGGQDPERDENPNLDGAQDPAELAREVSSAVDTDRFFVFGSLEEAVSWHSSRLWRISGKGMDNAQWE